MDMVLPNPNIWTLLSETSRIIKSHRAHFLALSIIFLLPLSFSSFFLLYSNPFFHSQHDQPINPTPLIIFNLLYSLFYIFFSLCGVSSITYSVFHGFYDQPLNLLSSIKSIFTSFFPLLATTIILNVIIFFISFFFVFLLFLLILGTQLIGITISFSSPYFIGFSLALVMLPLLFVVIYVQVNWTLVPIIVVMETCWGLQPLRRSASLMKGMKGVAVSLLLFFGFFGGILVWSSPVLRLLMMGSYGIPVTFDWVNILLLIMGKSLLLMVLMLFRIAANTVLYIYCKGIHGEHAEEFGKKDYVRYVPLVVSALDV